DYYCLSYDTSLRAHFIF
nr:immunoglobulin light chain junction region [Macaca mulatta]